MRLKIGAAVLAAVVSISAPANLVGNDYFGAIGSQQTAARRVETMDTVVYAFAIENDGDTDTFRLKATRGRNTFRAEYFSYPDRGNLTAAMTTGKFETPELAHRATAAYTVELTPLRSNGAFVGEIATRSVSVGEARDAVHSFTLVKARTKPPVKKGKGHGKR